MKKNLKTAKWNYDYQEDILYIRVNNENYLESLETEDIIIDLNNNNKIIGIEINKASIKFKLDKISLKNIKNGIFKIITKKNKIEISLQIKSSIRNKTTSSNLNIQKLISKSLIPSESSFAIT